MSALAMHYARQMNYTAFSGETRDRAGDFATAFKWASWSRSRPGHHDDHAHEDLPGIAEQAAAQFDALWQEHRAAKEAEVKAQLEARKAHLEAVKAEAEYSKQATIGSPPAPDFTRR